MGRLLLPSGAPATVTRPARPALSTVTVDERAASDVEPTAPLACGTVGSAFLR
jgi:hypothetical protein